MSWLALAALSAVFLGLYDVSKKSSLDDNAVLPVLFFCTLASVVLLVPVACVGWLRPDFAASAHLALAPLGTRGHLLVVAKAAIVTLSWIFTYFALKHLPISLASPIRASAPVFTVIGAVLLFAEIPTALQTLGIALTLGSYYLFSLVGREEGVEFTKNRWVWMLFAGTLVGAVSGLYDKHLLQVERLAPTSVQVFFAIYAAALQGFVVLVFWWPRRKGTTRFEFRRSIPLVALLLVLADNVYFRAVSEPDALISVVSAIRRSNVVISFVVGGILLRERLHARKVLALAGVLLGAVLLLDGG
ncbi:MAG TPA: DMT family transporter [Polyangiaceae bacterium]|nr:DMT family transporter [Polyangiaceae bacterium]